MAKAEDVAQTRCPYRDKNDQCTAKFRCRHQLAADELATASEKEARGAADGADLMCTHDGRFDYRSAWESYPRAYDKAKAKIESIREDARRRREGGDSEEEE